MSKRQWIMLIGIIIILLPFLGFLASWNRIIMVCLGLIIIALAYRMSPPTDSSPTGPASYTDSITSTSPTQEQ